MNEQSGAAVLDEIERGERFGFGSNWARFLASINEERIESAVDSLRTMLQLDSLAGKRFLDAGSGSGLFSLAARSLGARVHSFDYDPRSVGCTGELRRRYRPDDPEWTVEQGSVLDRDYLESLGEFDIVYSWGVLHHTGAMWDALEAVRCAVRPGGTLFIAIYNDMGAESERWVRMKSRYCRLPEALRVPYALWVMLPYEVREFGRALLDGVPGSYLRGWTRTGDRGMNRWRDIIDWVGGFPYEYASIAALTDFYAARGFTPVNLVGTGGLGCNQLVFENRPGGLAGPPLSVS